MILTLPTKQYDLIAFGLIVTVSVILLLMVGSRLLSVQHNLGFGIPTFPLFFFMKEDSKWHTVLYALIFVAVVAAAVLLCIN